MADLKGKAGIVTGGSSGAVCGNLGKNAFGKALGGLQGGITRDRKSVV